MATVSSLARPFFLLRLGVALLSLVGFWVCVARVEGSFKPAVSAVPVPGGTAAPKGPDPVPGNPTGPAQPASGETPAAQPLAILIDPGHGGADGGTVGNNLLEKDWTLKTGLALAEELRRRGHEVVLTRETDITLPLMDRPVLANAAPRLALISIHFNAGAADASGVETWYSWPKKPEIMARLHAAEGVPVEGLLPDDGEQLAVAIQSAVISRTNARDRGIKNRDDLAMTSRTRCPAVLIECGFLSNATESRRIQEVGYRKKLVQGIADGFEAWQKNRRSQPLQPSLDLLPVASSGTGAAGDAEH